jgi:hypothetical protein
MFVLLDRKSLKTALPDVPAAMIVLAVTPYVRVEQPVHPPAQVAILGGDNDQVEVVGHQAKAQNGKGNFNTGMGHRFKKGLIIGLFTKDRGAIIAPIEHMIANPANRSSARTRHERGNNKVIPKSQY